MKLWNNFANIVIEYKILTANNDWSYQNENLYCISASSCYFLNRSCKSQSLRFRNFKRKQTCWPIFRTKTKLIIEGYLYVSGFAGLDPDLEGIESFQSVMNSNLFLIYVTYTPSVHRNHHKNNIFSYEAYSRQWLTHIFKEDKKHIY